MLCIFCNREISVFHERKKNSTAIIQKFIYNTVASFLGKKTRIFTSAVKVKK